MCTDSLNARPIITNHYSGPCENFVQVEMNSDGSAKLYPRPQIDCVGLLGIGIHKIPGGRHNPAQVAIGTESHLDHHRRQTNEFSHDIVSSLVKTHSGDRIGLWSGFVKNLFRPGPAAIDERAALRFPEKFRFCIGELCL